MFVLLFSRLVDLVCTVLLKFFAVLFKPLCHRPSWCCHLADSKLHSPSWLLPPKARILVAKEGNAMVCFVLTPPAAAALAAALIVNWCAFFPKPSVSTKILSTFTARRWQRPLAREPIMVAIEPKTVLVFLPSLVQYGRSFPSLSPTRGSRESPSSPETNC